MIDRPQYLNWLHRWKDKELIKVVTGLRRSGKSTILEQFQDELMDRGVDRAHILSINFESFEEVYPTESRELYDYVVKRLPPKAKTYVFLDEIQHVHEFEKVVDALYVRGDVDLYITGSNAYYLSGELATLLTGRYVELTMFPLSFGEYYPAMSSSFSVDQGFERYLNYGGLPYVASLTDERAIAEYLGGVFNTILVKDIAHRRPQMNMRAFEATAAFLADNIGNISSTNKISEKLSHQGTKIARGTVDEYIDALTENYLLFQAKRFDLRGKAYLERFEKHYLGDLGFRFWLLGKKAGDIGHRLENIVYLELRRRFDTVAIGKQGAKEVDFIAVNAEGTHYFQVAQTVLDEETLKRELAPLQDIKDNYKKTLLTLDTIGLGDFEGIEHANLINWLLAPSQSWC